VRPRFRFRSAGDDRSLLVGMQPRPPSLTLCCVVPEACFLTREDLDPDDTAPPMPRRQTQRACTDDRSCCRSNLPIVPILTLIVIH